MENKKLSQEELQQLKQFQSESNNITLTLGQIDIQRALLEDQRSMELGKLVTLQDNSKTLAKELQEKYGDGTVDLVNGEFIPNRNNP